MFGVDAVSSSVFPVSGCGRPPSPSITMSTIFPRPGSRSTCASGRTKSFMGPEYVCIPRLGPRAGSRIACRYARVPSTVVRACRPGPTTRGDRVRLEPFLMERWQSTYEHRVRYNLSESGVHPLSVEELLALAGRDPATLAQMRLGYGQSNGSDELRHAIAGLYQGATEQNVLVTVGGAEANLACAWHLVEEGESVAVMLPNYMQVPGLAGSFGARV